jgi:GT2 family glycosyltransferase
MVAPASIVIPTRGRPDYLRVALASVAPQAQAQGAELLVVDDDVASDSTRQLVQSFGARYLAHGARQGLNVARNTGVAHTSGDLVVLIDDDVEVRPGWLAALLDAAATLTDVDVFSGPIYARLEGPAPRSCGREKPPITALDLGPDDRDTVYAWGANMALRRSALQRVGAFDVTIEHGGDEQEWQDRLRAEGPARVRYVAGAAVDHRRVGPDARLRSLARSASVRGRAARRFDERRGVQPGLVRELVRLAGCLGHVVRYRCPAGLVMVAHSAGRLAQAVAGPHQAPAGGRAAHAGSASAAIAAEDARRAARRR